MRLFYTTLICLVIASTAHAITIAEQYDCTIDRWKDCDAACMRKAGPSTLTIFPRQKLVELCQAEHCETVSAQMKNVLYTKMSPSIVIEIRDLYGERYTGRLDLINRFYRLQSQRGGMAGTCVLRKFLQ